MGRLRLLYDSVNKRFRALWTYIEAHAIWSAFVAGLLVLLVAGIIGLAYQAATADDDANRASRTTVIGFLATDLDESVAVDGFCWFQSMAARRALAYRCMTGNQIHDPCFSEFFQDPLVLCPHSPTATTDDVVIFADFTPYDEFVEERGRFENLGTPWYFVTSDGLSCIRATGTAPFSPFAALSFWCGGPTSCDEPHQTDGEWSVTCVNLEQTAEIATYLIERIWF